MSESIRAVAFDLDGLMFNTELLYEEVGCEMLRRRDKVMTRELLNEMMGRPSPVALQIMIDWHDLSDTVAELEQETDDTFDKILHDRLQPMPGLLELLEAAQIPKAITTSSRRAFLDKVLSISQLSGRFLFEITAEDVTQGKPAPEIYQTAAERFRVPTLQMMVLEDSEIGCRAAVAAGAYTVAVPGDHSRHHDFTNVTLTATSLADPGIYDALKNGGA